MWPLLSLLASPGLAAEPAGLGLSSLAPSSIEIGARDPIEVPKRIDIQGPFRLVSIARGVRTYEAPLPVRPRALFYHAAPQGMTLTVDGKPYTYAAGFEDWSRPGTFEITSNSILIRLRRDADAPSSLGLQLTYPIAKEREQALHRAAFEGSDKDFVFRTLQVDDTSRTGVYLPAPSSVRWKLTPPANAHLRMDLGVIPPEIDTGARSDGVNLTVKIDDQEIARERVSPGASRAVDLDLSAFAGREITLTLQSSDGDPTRDHLFVGAPSLYTPSDAPKRVILVFVDTLRRDHLGLYGYERPTTPKLDTWAKDAVIFEDARTVAPWTLPSTRALLTGRQPEFWKEAARLPRIFGAAGWATGAYVGNVYLSSNFEMADDWGEHGCINWPYATAEVDRGLEFLRAHPKQDAMLMVHFMDMHLPYKEPYRYQNVFVKERPKGLGDIFLRPDLLMLAERGRKNEIKKYLIDRYDQNLRYIDDELQRLLEAAGEDAVVVFFSDHGEEFFDHGDLEHGHTLYDELLRIPLIVRDPTLTGRRVAAPVSLLDVAPTLLERFGFSTEGLDGRSLLGLARGEVDASFDSRPLAFGRPLYSWDAWGSLQSGVKYLSRAGEEEVYDVRQDPHENKNLRIQGLPRAGREALSTALGQPAALAFRVAPSESVNGDTAVEIHIPGGVEQVWVGDDPTERTLATYKYINAETLRLDFVGFRENQREIFILPRQDAESIIGGVTLKSAQGGSDPVALKALPMTGQGEDLARVRYRGKIVSVTYAYLPLPSGQATSGFDPEVSAALQSMGYLDGGRAPSVTPGADDAGD